ncbi:vacuolar protein sorting-associated protein 74 [Rhizoctonia solani]|uniref:Golgi phosphoprotein 3 (GPP34) n=1 Tax=Rhizoctonia solani TaxID=456999 RepID=A0A8H8NLK1_9AGAM
MAQSGLSRRRVGTSTPTPNDGDTFTPSAPSPVGNSNGRTYGGGTALEGGGKIAYDPRDLETEGEGKSMPRLTILEEVLLLGIKDKQGYLSFWNDNISYALRGCILMELALRRRIGMVKDSARRRYPLPDRLIEVIDERQTGETILDEALKMIKASEKMGVGTWIDLMSGETWNVMKIGYQLKQVRERLAKGLVDKGVLRTEKTNFLLFDMATHPVADARTKDEVMNRVVNLLTTRTTTVPDSALGKEGTQFRAVRAVCLVTSAYAASVLENALARLGYDAREAALSRCDDILAEFSAWPFGAREGGAEAQQRRRPSSGDGSSSIAELLRLARAEIGADGAEDVSLEVISAVLEVFGRMDNIL